MVSTGKNAVLQQQQREAETYNQVQKQPLHIKTLKQATFVYLKGQLFFLFACFLLFQAPLKAFQTKQDDTLHILHLSHDISAALQLKKRKSNCRDITALQMRFMWRLRADNYCYPACTRAASCATDLETDVERWAVTSPLACCVTPAHFHLCTRVTDETLTGVREEQSRSCQRFTEPPAVWDRHTNTLTYHDCNWRGREACLFLRAIENDWNGE